MDTLLTIGLIILGIIIFIIGVMLGNRRANRKWEAHLPDIREDAIKRSRSVLGGQFSEQLAPYLPDFPYKPTEAKFIGKPLDFIVIKGLDEQAPREIIFVEVKSGNSSLNKVQRALKKVVDGKQVRWEEYRVPHDITSAKE